MRQPSIHNLTVIICILLAFVILAFAARCAHGHEAPSGWQYPNDCCGGNDCKPISCSTVITKPDGGASWLGLYFTRTQIRYSGDSSCHVCVSYGQINGEKAMPTRAPHCLFLSPMN